MKSMDAIISNIIKLGVLLYDAMMTSVLSIDRSGETTYIETPVNFYDLNIVEKLGINFIDGDISDNRDLFLKLMQFLVEDIHPKL